jgi:hypothetical protein
MSLKTIISFQAQRKIIRPNLDLDLKNNKGEQIFDVEPTATIVATITHPKELVDIEEGECWSYFTHT